MRLNSIERFGGCGGLGLGLARAGFRSRAFVERNDNAIATVRHNILRGVEHVRDWRLAHADIRGMDWKPLRGALSLISGGPPCQPFGIGGLKKGAEDARDMWPEAIRAVHESEPGAFLFENVRNLTGPRFGEYLEWIERRLRHVATAHADGTPVERLRRLLRMPIAYRTTVAVVNAADYGAPQVRHRVLLAGARADLGVDPGHPRRTHSLHALLWTQWATGEYWTRHGMPMPGDKAIPGKLHPIVAKLRSQMVPPPLRPWVTVRDAIAGLGEPDGLRDHVFQPGGRVYPGHTGSPLDMPAKALKAGDHGVPGGENMAILDDGSVRYFTLRESARLTGLPDDYGFCRSWTESMRCLGNAVPVQLGEAAGNWMRSVIEVATTKTRPQGRAA